MNDPLDLCILLTPPPSGSPPDSIASVTLQIAQWGLLYKGELIADPLTPDEQDELTWYLESYLRAAFGEFSERAKHAEKLLGEVGRRLYRAVFKSPEASELVRLIWAHEGLRQISIVSDIPAALNLPWELLHDEIGFVALREERPIGIVRRLPQVELAKLLPLLQPPLRVLFVAPRPDSIEFIDHRSIATQLLDKTQDLIRAGVLEFEFLRPPTLRALRNRLADNSRPPIQVLHFDGHGTLEAESNLQSELGGYGQERGLLVFEDRAGRLDQVGSDTLAQMMQNRNPQLILLTTSQSTLGVAEDAFNTISLQLLRAGVGVITGLNPKAWETSTAYYAETLYRALLKGTPAIVAHQQAQQTLYSNRKQRMSTSKSGESVAASDWWVPRLYLQQPLTLATGSLNLEGETVLGASFGGQSSNEYLPGEPLYGFSGRARELWQIENNLRRRALLVIHGFGGIGKTALAREAAVWLTRTKLYDHACFIPFQQDSDTNLLLSILSNQLDLSYRPGREEAFLNDLAHYSSEHPLLVIADGLGHMLSNSQYQMDPDARIRLWHLISELARIGVGIIITSRDASSVDKSLGERLPIAYLPLEGLNSDDACLLALRGLDKLGFNRANIAYTKLKELLSQLDNHPLATEVILPFLRRGDLAALKEWLDVSLPRYTDDSITGLSRALQISLDLLLNQLSEEQRLRLSGLKVFEGIVSKDAALYIIQMSEEQWIELCSILITTGLLIPLQINGIDPIYFSLHSVLASRLESLPSDDNGGSLRQRYVDYYAWYAHYLFEEDERRSRLVRNLVLRELPNLRLTLDILFEQKDFDSAFRMARVMEHFLKVLGMKSALDRLLQKMQAVASKTDGRLTIAAYHYEMQAAEREFSQGDFVAASARLNELLTRLQSKRQNSRNEPGVREKFELLITFSYYLLRMREPRQAEERLSQAQNLLNDLVKQGLDSARYSANRLVILRWLVPALMAQNKLDEAEEAARTALQLVEQNLVEERVNGGQRINFICYLGEVAQQRENYEEARDHYMEALELARSQDETREIPYLWNRLGDIASRQGQWSEAERAFRESLEILEKWNQEAEIARVCSKIAAVAEAVGRFAEAESWYKRGLEILIRLGVQEEVVDVLAHLASLIANEARSGRASKTRLSEARQYAEMVHKAREDLLGGSHPATAQSLTTLGLILQTQGELDAARPHLEKALEITERALGQKHIDTAQSLKNLADLLQAQGDSQTARPLLERALAVYKGFYGENHPSIAQTLHSMATLLSAQGNLTAALPLLEQALKIDEAHLEPYSQEILLLHNDLALLHYEIGNIEGAQSNFNYIFTSLSQKFSAQRKSRRAAEALLNSLTAVTKEMYTAGTSNSQRARTEALGRGIAVLSEFSSAKIDIPPSDQVLIERITDRWRDVITREVGRAGQRGILKEVPSPYIFTAPVSGAALVGRDDVFRRINSLWAHEGQRNSLLIHGHRRMGKTSVAQALATRCNFGGDTKLIYHSLEGQTLREGEVYLSIALRLWRYVKDEMKMPEMDEYVKGNARIRFDVFLADFNEKREDMRIVLVLDEFELLYRRMGSQHAEEIIGHLRTQTQVYPWLALALVGLSDLEDLSLSYQSALLGWEPIAVSFLDAHEVAKVLTNPASDPDFPLDYSQEALDEIFAITNGQPYLVQVIGDLLVQHYNRIVFTEQRVHSRVFDLADVHAVVNNPHFYATAAAYFQGVWGQATKGQPGEAHILKALAISESGLSETELQSAIQNNGRNFTYARDSLKRHAVICLLDGRWHYAVPLMRRWVQENCLSTHT